MNWVFLDAMPWDYDIATPSERPLGGSQSALCYLAAALAHRGHEVSAVTGTSRPRTVQGVRCVPQELFGHALLRPPNTIVVVLNGPAELGRELRKYVPGSLCVVLWVQHATNQPAVWGLRDPQLRSVWNRIVCVSDWQRTTYGVDLGVPESQSEVLRNAVAPAFVGRWPTEEPFHAAKAGEPRLAYTSTPFRGLDHLLKCFPTLQVRHPTCELHIYSSLEVYFDPESRDPYQSLYAQCRGLAGATYHGSVGQSLLAERLGAIHVLAYPNSFAETSCIAALEALASGAWVVTSDRGALPETCQGWATLVAPADGKRSVADFERDFVEAVDQVLIARHHSPDEFGSRQYRQATAVQAACNWDARAAEWEAAGERWLACTAQRP